MCTLIYNNYHDFLLSVNIHHQIKIKCNQPWFSICYFGIVHLFHKFNVYISHETSSYQMTTFIACHVISSNEKRIENLVCKFQGMEKAGKFCVFLWKKLFTSGKWLYISIPYESLKHLMLLVKLDWEKMEPGSWIFRFDA